MNLTLDGLRQDLRVAIRSSLRTPGFALVAVLTLALGIGANTAIFSIVNGVVLRPLGYPKPEQLMFLTSQFPALRASTSSGCRRRSSSSSASSTQSFSDVGAFTTAEVNLMAGDRPRRVRAAAVTDDVLRALQVPPAHGRLFNRGETDVTSQPGPPGTPPPAAPPDRHPVRRALAVGLRRPAGRRPDRGGQRPHARDRSASCRRALDVMDNRTEIWLPLGLNPANRQNRGSHFLYLIGRLKDGVSAAAAQAELDVAASPAGASVPA